MWFFIQIFFKLNEIQNLGAWPLHVILIIEPAFLLNSLIQMSTLFGTIIFFLGGGCQSLLVSKSNKLIQLLDLVLWIYRSISFWFQTDKGFDKRTFAKQMGVMRGQVNVPATHNITSPHIEMIKQIMLSSK